MYSKNGAHNNLSFRKLSCLLYINMSSHTKECHIFTGSTKLHPSSDKPTWREFERITRAGSNESSSDVIAAVGVPSTCDTSEFFRAVQRHTECGSHLPQLAIATNCLTTQQPIKFQHLLHS